MNLRSSDGFGAFVEGSKRRNTAKTIRQYAARFGHILDDGNASELLSLTPKVRTHAMAALAALSKYQGRYNEWKQIMAAYGLKWKINDDLQTFESITQGADLDAMLLWIRDASKAAPAYKDVFRYACLTGLRPAEVFLSLGLPNERYYNAESGILEHYRFPNLFIRATKKAYVSIVTPEILQLRDAANSTLSYNALRLTLQRRKTPMKMNYTRKIHGTFLKTHGIDAEIVDLLQGRLPRSVFSRHYFRPGFKTESEKVRDCLGKLSKEILYQ